MEEISKEKARELLIDADIRECSCNQQFLEDLVKEYHDMRFDSTRELQRELDEIWPGQYKIEQ